MQSLYYGDDFTQAREYEYIKNVQTDEQLKQAKENPILIHYAGKAGKPWRMKKPYPDYKQFMDKLPKELKQTTLRDIRKKLFNKR